jgi:tRNA(His) guanylyltransferase
MKHDEFGDRMKALEGAFTSAKVSPDKWMAVRIDGRGFSKYTKGFSKPFSGRITGAMKTATEALMKETHASVGYTQSDEITLLYPPSEGERIFGGKVSKINSVFASIATAHFNHFMKPYHDKHAYFDCRAWEVPDEVEASNTLLWRVQDARKNSVSSHFRWTVGHKAMQNLNSSEMIQYLIDHNKEDWYDLPNVWKYGTYLKNVTREAYLTQAELDEIPESKRPTDLKFVRKVIESVDLGYFGDLSLEQRVNFVK